MERKEFKMDEETKKKIMKGSTIALKVTGLAAFGYVCYKLGIKSAFNNYEVVLQAYDEVGDVVKEVVLKAVD